MFDQVHGQIASHEQFSKNVPSMLQAISTTSTADLGARSLSLLR
jgi:hypothetical protein